MSSKITTARKRQTTLVPGETYGRLTAVAWVKTVNKNAYFKFKCACGQTKIAAVTSVRAGKVRSCGCLRKETAARMGRHWHPLNLTKMAQSKSKVPGQDSARRLFSGYKRDALKRGLAFELDFASFVQLTSAPCAYCGTPPASVIKGRQKIAVSHYAYNGIDRIENALGYTLQNATTACFSCNHAKHTRTRQEFLTWLARAARYCLRSRLV